MRSVARTVFCFMNPPASSKKINDPLPTCKFADNRNPEHHRLHRCRYLYRYRKPLRRRGFSKAMAIANPTTESGQTRCSSILRGSFGKRKGQRCCRSYPARGAHRRFGSDSPGGGTGGSINASSEPLHAVVIAIAIETPLHRRHAEGTEMMPGKLRNAGSRFQPSIFCG